MNPTQVAGGHRSREERISEERIPLEEELQRLPEITIGALYAEEIDDYEDWSEEDKNNNYLVDPDEKNLTKHHTNLESMRIEKENDRTHWSQLVDESSRRHILTKRQEEPETNKTRIKRRNSEEHSYRIDDGMSAEMPCGENNVKAETTGQPSILRALLERATRDDIHSKIKTKEEHNLKNKKILEQKNNQLKWKNMMTMIHYSTLNNINLTCGGSCILRREINESGSSNQSLNETISIVSGTDSQYEQINKEDSPERWSQEVLPSDASRRDVSQTSLIYNYTPEQSPEGQRMLWPNNHPDQPKEYKKFALIKPTYQKIVLRGEEDPQEAAGKTVETCKKRKRKVNKIHKRRRNKLNNRLIPYYRKIKAKIQTYRIYYLKRY